MSTIDWVGLDADDTLWHSEGHFTDAQVMFCELVAPWVTRDIDPAAVLDETERRNLATFGYGVKAFTLSMLEAAVAVSDGTVPGGVITQLIERGKWMLDHPVELLDGVSDTVHALAHTYRLAIITKGDLVHQERKLATSGLADVVHVVEIVSEKDPDTYRRVLARNRIAVEGFVMVGNAVRSDVLPVIAIGGRAVHIPYEQTWGHEHAEHDGTVPTLDSIRQLPGWLATQR
jgi:putative hydrolase of the HAD superfamily